jgi:HK97 gp10 family phage protein
MAQFGLTGNVGDVTRKKKNGKGGTLITARQATAAEGETIDGVIIRENNMKLVEENIDNAIVRALEIIGLTAENYAKKACPVDTGRLRNSITHSLAPDENAVYIGTNVEYAQAVELGTSRQKAQPYLAPAATRHKSQYQQILNDELKRELD